MKSTKDDIEQAYYLAAIAVTANEFGVPVEKLSMPHGETQVPSVVLELLERYCKTDPDDVYWKQILIEEYLTVLISGGIGRLILKQNQQSQIMRVTGGDCLVWSSLRETLACHEKEADTAYAIALGRLQAVDGGDPCATLYRLWNRATRLLQEPKLREQVVRLARHLLKTQQLTGQEIGRFLET